MWESRPRRTTSVPGNSLRGGGRPLLIAPTMWASTSRSTARRFPNASEYSAATPHCVARSEMSFIVQELLAATIPTGLGITAGGAYWDKIFFNGIRGGRGELGVNAARKA